MINKKIVISLLVLFSFCFFVSCGGQNTKETSEDPSTSIIDFACDERSNLKSNCSTRCSGEYNNSESIDWLTDNGYVEWRNDNNGKLFSYDKLYILNKMLDKCPLTFEATIELSDTIKDCTGIIFGNYGEETETVISFEICQNGNPRLFFRDSSWKIDDLVFENVFVNTNSRTNLSISNDPIQGV